MASATHVYRNGTILTMDSGGSQAQALAVRGKPSRCRLDAEIMALADQHTVVTDLRGRTISRFHRRAQPLRLRRPHGGHAARSSSPRWAA